MRRYWPWLRAGLEQIERRFPSDWIPEDIFGVLKAGAATAFIVGDEDGFLILQQQQRFSGPCLFVWIVHGELAQHEQQIYDALDALARQGKFASIECHGRKGWARRGFFTAGETVYRRKVS